MQALVYFSSYASKFKWLLKDLDLSKDLPRRQRFCSRHARHGDASLIKRKNTQVQAKAWSEINCCRGENWKLTGNIWRANASYT